MIRTIGGKPRNSLLNKPAETLRFMRSLVVETSPMSCDQHNTTNREGHSEPHPKDGHIRLPNEIVDRLAQLQISGAEWQIIFATWRRTLGWQRSGEWKNDPYPISLGDLSRATRVNRRHIAPAGKWNGIRRSPSKARASYSGLDDSETAFEYCAAPQGRTN